LTESINTIFDHNIKLLGDIDRAIYYFREQQYDKALTIVANSIDEIKFVIETIISNQEYFNLVATESLLEMLTGILNAKKNKDFILLADLLQLQLINFLVGVQELIISKEEMVFDEKNYKENIDLLVSQGIGFQEEFKATINTSELLEKGYRVEFTSCGQMTLAAMNEGAMFYFHTNNMIRSEAFTLAKHWYRKDKNKYIIFGLGMGYHVSELLEMADDIEIEVYETDENVLKLACAFADIKQLLRNPRLKLVYDPELSRLKQRISDVKEEEFVIHYPSYKNIRSSENKQLIHAQLSWIETIEAL
jgi:Uncharacterized protein conserved in bacteria